VSKIRPDRRLEEKKKKKIRTKEQRKKMGDSVETGKGQPALLLRQMMGPGWGHWKELG